MFISNICSHQSVRRNRSNTVGSLPCPILQYDPGLPGHSFGWQHFLRYVKRQAAEGLFRTTDQWKAVIQTSPGPTGIANARAP